MDIFSLFGDKRTKAISTDASVKIKFDDSLIQSALRVCNVNFKNLA